jgi:flavin reductase (DIM6/NTAB) family NADH-FMN oxidoreductase RutF
MAVNPNDPATKVKVPFALDKMVWHPTPLMNQVTLVTTLNEDGTSNVAPKSCVSMMIFRPALLAMGCNLAHWTARNIRRGGEFVVNVPGAELADVAWSVSELPHPRTLESAGLTPVPSREVKVPGIAECRAHIECVFEREIVYGEEIILLGRLVAASIDQEVLEAPDPYTALRLFAFLEEKRFGVLEKSERL